MSNDRTEAPPARRRPTQLNVRVTSEEKELLQEAATRAGLTLRDFVLKAGLLAAHHLGPKEWGILRHDPQAIVSVLGQGPRIESEQPETVLTARMRNRCQAAAKGGAHKWADVGNELAIEAKSHPPPGIDDRTWYYEILELEAMLLGGHKHAALRWLGRHYPGVVAEIPGRAQSKVIEGAMAAAREGKVKTLPPKDALHRAKMQTLDAASDDEWGEAT